jgi:hypothetical protein
MNEPRPQTESELIELIRSSEARAPEALHRRIEQMVSESSRSGSSRRTAWGALAAGRSALVPRVGALAALAAVLVAVLAILLGGGGRSLSVQQTAALTLSHATAAPPAEMRPTSSELVAAVQGVHFPYWEERFGWRSSGQRSDTLGGRTVMTVFYSNASGRRVGYAIVSGTAPSVRGGSEHWLGGTAFRLFGRQGAQTVTWLRHGRLCVLSGRGVDAGTLLRLASWRQRGAVA